MYNIIKQETFMLRAILIKTIYDSLDHATVRGFAHQGYAACLWYRLDLGDDYSMVEKQICGGTKRWLLENHKY